jgi:hypothetical protein
MNLKRLLSEVYLQKKQLIERPGCSQQLGDHTETNAMEKMEPGGYTNNGLHAERHICR